MVWNAYLSGHKGLLMLTVSEGQMRNIRHLYPFTLEAKIRVSRNQVISDDAVIAFASFLRSMLQYEPSHRTEAGAAARDPWLS